MFKPQSLASLSGVTAVVVILVHILGGYWLCRLRLQVRRWTISRASLTFAAISFASIPVALAVVKAEFLIADRIWPSADWLLEGLPATLIIFGAAPVIAFLSVVSTLYALRFNRPAKKVAAERRMR